MKLYSQPGACSTSSHIVLEWAGLDHELQTITREFKRTPEYLELNPTGVVPTLVDGDFVLTQNAAIYAYIADHAPDSGLYGDGSARQRAEANRWISYVGSDLHPVFKPLFVPAAHGGDGPGADDVRASALANVARTLQHAERRLADHEWLAGFRSPADAYLYITLRWAIALGVELTPALTAFVGRMERHEQVLKALSDEGLDTVG